MPFKSEAQRRFMHAQHPEIAKRWEKKTPKGKDLPERKNRAQKAAQVVDFDPLERIGLGVLTAGTRIPGVGRKLQAIHDKAVTSQRGESIRDALTLMGLSSIATGTGLGMGLGSRYDATGLGGAVGGLAGAAPAALATEPEPPKPSELERWLKQAGTAATGGSMHKAAESAKLLKLDSKGISPTALHALYGGNLQQALSEPGVAALATRRAERLRRLKDELRDPLSHLPKPKEQKTPQQPAEAPMMPGPAAGPMPPGMPMAPGMPVAPSNHMGGMVAMAGENMDKATAERAAAYKFGFLTKVAETGMLPSEFVKRAAGVATAVPIIGGRAAGRGTDAARGLAGTAVDKMTNILSFATKTPLVLAPILGFGLGLTVRGLTAPSYERPRDLQHLELLSAYRRKTEAARRRAKQRQRDDERGDADPAAWRDRR